MSSQNAVAPSRQARRVLIVDDAPGMRRYLNVILTDAGYTCIEAGDGAEAFNIVLDGKVDLVITDLDMPEMDGFGLIASITLLPPRRRPPILVVSALLDENLADQRRELRAAVALLAKPVQPDDVLRAVSRALDAQLPTI